MSLHMMSPMPSIDGGTNWYNCDPLTTAYFSSSICLIHFFAVSCESCKLSLPDINTWYTDYGNLGVKILSVHMPRSENDTDIKLVEEVIAEYKIKQPCVVDNWHTIADAFSNKYVPSFYLFDKDSKLRHFQAGERASKMVEPVIKRLLQEANTTITKQEDLIHE